MAKATNTEAMMIFIGGADIHLGFFLAVLSCGSAYFSCGFMYETAS